MVLFTIQACSTQIDVEPTAALGVTETALPLYGMPLGCQPEVSLLNNLRAQLPYQQAVVIYQAYGGEHSLVVWLAAPELDGGFRAENEYQATEIAVSAARVLLGASVCVGKFDLLHITVVGGDYTQWFSGPIRPADVPPDEKANTGGGHGGDRGAGISAVTAAPDEAPRPDDCDWQTARENLAQQFDSVKISISDFYFIRDAGNDFVYAHWVLAGDQTPEELLPLLSKTADELSCLIPRPTGISLTIAGEDGVVQLTGFLPGSVSRRKTRFDLDDLSYQLLGAP